MKTKINPNWNLTDLVFDLAKVKFELHETVEGDESIYFTGYLLFSSEQRVGKQTKMVSVPFASIGDAGCGGSFHYYPTEVPGSSALLKGFWEYTRNQRELSGQQYLDSDEIVSPLVMAALYDRDWNQNRTRFFRSPKIAYRTPDMPEGECYTAGNANIPQAVLEQLVLRDNPTAITTWSNMDTFLLGFLGSRPTPYVPFEGPLQEQGS